MVNGGGVPLLLSALVSLPETVVSEPAAAAAADAFAAAMVVISPHCPGDDWDVAVECQQVFYGRFAHRAGHFFIKM